jgi:phosphatidylserine/phosphatidylglycerophosphate/cardiolipin synthase-like enzyme
VGGEKAKNQVKLIIQPEAGLMPVVKAIKKAKKTIDIVIFRLDRTEIEKALHAAVARGVVVRALIAHTNRGGENALRKLEQRLLECGATVSRTADNLPRYHGKMMIVDRTLHVYGFNYTKVDIDKSRSFGVLTRDKRLVAEAMKLFDADNNRTPYEPAHKRLVVSPETSRQVLTEFIKSARKELLIYDEQVTDNLLQRVLLERVKAGVEIRIIGKLEKKLPGVKVRKLADMRLHVRAIVRDRKEAFVGSQSLRKLELDGRREVGVVVNDSRLAKRIAEVFYTDWSHALKVQAKAS